GRIPMIGLGYGRNCLGSRIECNMVRTSAHWRQCANKCRHLADQSRDPPIRNTILDIALLYERLAIHAEVSVTLRSQQRLLMRRRKPELAERQPLQTDRV